MEEKKAFGDWHKPGKKKEGEPGVDHERIAREIWDKLQHADHFAMERGFLIEKIDEIYEKGKADQRAKKKGKKE